MRTLHPVALTVREREREIVPGADQTCLAGCMFSPPLVEACGSLWNVLSSVLYCSVRRRPLPRPFLLSRPPADL